MIANRTTIFIKKLFSQLFFMLAFGYVLLISIGVLYSDDLIFLPQPISYRYSDDLVSIQSSSATDNDTQHAIVARYLFNPDAKYTVIYSHGNAVDLGGLVNVQQKFFDRGYSVIIYDYSGYGLSEGEASEQQVYNDVQAVYDYLVSEQKVEPGKIISYGHSLGAAIATDLAYKNPLAGLALESPFTTAFRVKTIYPLVPFDKFASIDKINKITAPVFITHSRDDPVIAFWHGEDLFAKANEPKSSLWLDDQGHSGITHDDTFWLAFNSYVSGIRSGLN